MVAALAQLHEGVEHPALAARPKLSQQRVRVVLQEALVPLLLQCRERYVQVGLNLVRQRLLNILLQSPERKRLQDLERSREGGREGGR